MSSNILGSYWVVFIIGQESYQWYFKGYQLFRAFSHIALSLWLSILTASIILKKGRKGVNPDLTLFIMYVVRNEHFVFALFTWGGVHLLIIYITACKGSFLEGSQWLVLQDVTFWGWVILSDFHIMFAIN